MRFSFPAAHSFVIASRSFVSVRRVFAVSLGLLGAPLTLICQQAVPAAKVLSFHAAAVGISAGSAQTLTASFLVSGYAGSFTPTAALHYGHDYTLGPIICTPGAGSETCTVTVSFQPSLPGTRKDAIFLTSGTTRLATVLLGGVGQAPLSLVQPGAFSTSIPNSGFSTSGYDYIYQSVADENGTVYLLPSGNAKFIWSVTKAGVVTQIPLTNAPYWGSIAIDGAGVLYIFNESTTVTTYDTVQGIQGTYNVPYAGPDTNWYPGAVGADNSIYIVDQIRNNGVAYEFHPDGNTAYAATLNPGVLQPFTAALDSAGNFFVGGYEINKVTPAGVQTQVNTVGASDGLAVDAADTLYATRYSPTGGVAELPASNYTTPIASIDTHSSPLGLALGSDGTVYVSNYVNLDIFDRSTTETIDFGGVAAGASSTLSTASVYNGGNQPLTISAFTLSTVSDSGFRLDFSAANECTFGIVLAPGALCQVSVVFAPTHPGAFVGTISIVSNSLNGAATAQTILLNGVTDGSYDVVSPNPLVFPSQTPGASNTQAVTLTNQGSSYASTVYSVATDNPAFTIAQGSCSGVAVQVGASCQLQVTFTPTAVQAYSGNATIVTYVSGTSQAAQKITLPLSGAGTGPVAATPVITPGGGSYNSSQQVAITDTTANATIYYTTDGSAPTAASTKYTGAITVNSNETVSAIATATGYTQSAVASAAYTFHEGVAAVTPTSLAFGNQIQGIASVAQTVTLNNTGVGTLTLTGFPITGSAEFSQTNNCGGSLAAGSSCTLSVVFTPASLGDRTATLTVNSDSIQAAPTVALTGTGIVQPPVLTILSPTLDFGNQIINTNSAAQSVTLTNNSPTDTIVVGSIFSTSSGAILAQSATCSSPLAPGASCTVSVIFSPAAIQTYSGTVTFQPHISGCGGCVRNYPSQTLAVSGIGIPQPPVLSFSPASVDFGSTVVGSSTTVTVIVTNLSTTDTVFVGDVFTTSSVFFNAYSPKCSIPLAPGKSCPVLVTFNPSEIQSYSGTVTFQPQLNGCGGCAVNYPVQTVAVKGNSIAQPPVLTFSATTLDFGNQFVGVTSAVQSVTITNNSTTDTVALTNIAMSGFGYDFQPTTCTAPLAPGASCVISLNFTPKAAQAYSSFIIIVVQPSGCGGCVRDYPEQTIALSGAGIPQLPVLTLSPAALDFGNQLIKFASAVRSVTITNNSTTDTVVLTSIALTGFEFMFQPTTCTAPLAPGASCVISLNFTPNAAQAYSASVIILVQPSGCGGCVRDYPEQMIALTGTGVTPPPPTFSPASLAFGNEGLGTTSAFQTLTLTNPASANQPITMSSFVYASNSRSFSQTNNCPATLAAGASCQVQVSFTPSAGGAISDSLVLNYVEDGQPNFVSAALSGTGINPTASLTPAAMNFTTTAGTTSAPQTATLTNTGGVFLTIFNISVTGASPNNYRETNNCGSLLAAGASCTISVTFTAGFVGSYLATLMVSDNDPASPQTISLTGSAVVTPNFVIAAAIPAQTIPAGGSAQFALTVTAQNGATIPAVTLAASGLPTGATATFSASSITPGSASATSVLTIHAPATMASSPSAAWPLGAPTLALLGWLFIPHKRRRQVVHLGVLFLLSLGSIAALTGCGGSPTSKSYTIIVTASIGTVQQTTTVDLTVE